MNTTEFILENAAKQPEAVADKLKQLHQQGETVADILEFVEALEQRKIKVPHPGKNVYDICGTGGSGKPRINLSTALAFKLSETYAIAKHGNKAASGRVGSFDVIAALDLPIGDTPEKASEQLQSQNLSFVYVPAFHPALKPMAPIRQSLGHPSIFNYLGPLLNPVPLRAQMIGVSSLEVGEKLAEVCAHLGKNALIVHDTAFGLDDVSIGGATKFWAVGLEKQKIHSGVFFPEDYGFTSARDFNDIAGGDTATNQQILEQLLSENATTAQLDFLNINYRIAAEFFERIG